MVTINLAAQSTHFKLKPSTSKDNGIFIEAGAYNFIEPYLSGKDAKGRDTLNVIVHKSDCIKALGNIMCSLPLYTSKSGISQVQTSPVPIFEELSAKIRDFFGEESTKELSGLYFTDLQGRKYVWGTEGRSATFEIRKFFIANHTSITFNTDDDNVLHLRFDTYIVSENREDFQPLKTQEIPEIVKNDISEPLQQIFFGAPGTGKSHTIKEACKKHPHYRITFHPDTDYAAFVGSYKPITVEEPVYTNIGTAAHPVVDTATGTPLTAKKITYNYVTQPFLKAYIKAWEEQENENPQPVFLVIEEINRGNCAQIFGDIFQLLDRNEIGYSDYPITTDSDLEKELAKVFANLNIQNEEAINNIYEDDVVSKVKAGTHLLLPNNLYIWATMNTSDQSLFPIDSAFKRRWDWKYIKISDSGMNYRIAVNEKEYDWWEFVQAINRKIEDEGTQEDKKLGYFFAKTTKSADGRYIINADKFLSKVLFFLYNDVYKDFGYDDDIFKGENGTPMQFADYFDYLGNTVEPAVERFLQNLGLKPINGDVDDESTDMDGDAPVKSGISARINGRKVGTITKALYQILSAVVDNYTYDDLYQSVKDSLTREDDVMKTIPSVDDYQKENRWYNNPLTTKDGVSFVITNQWKKDLLPQIENLASTLGISYENLSE